MGKLPYLCIDSGPDGKKRLYFRKRGRSKVRLRGPIGSAEFLFDYHQAVEGSPLPPLKLRGAVGALGKAKTVQASLEAHSIGTLGHLVQAYLLSPSFATLSQMSRAVRERFYLVLVLGDKKGIQPAQGDVKLADIDRAAIRRGRDKRADRPAASKNFLKYLTSLFEWAVEAGFMDHNPCHGVKPLPYAKKSFRSWQEADKQVFRDYWPLGSVPRTAFEILAQTAVRRSDVVAVGWQHVTEDGFIHLTQSKTGDPVWLPITDALWEALSAESIGLNRRPLSSEQVERSKGLSFVRKQNGAPYTYKSFGMRFRKWCEDAGVQPGLSAHGLRHALGNELATSGASKHEIAAALGHRGTGSVDRYTQGADAKLLADRAHARLGGQQQDPVDLAAIRAAKRAKIAG